MKLNPYSIIYFATYTYNSLVVTYMRRRHAPHMQPRAMLIQVLPRNTPNRPAQGYDWIPVTYYAIDGVIQ